MITFTIPKVPGSINHMYGQARNGRRYLRQQGKEYKELVQNIFSNIDIPIYIFQGRLRIHFNIYFSNYRKRDLDNCMKILWDSLEGHLFKDDAQIDYYSVKRMYDKDNPRVEVECGNNE